MSFAERPVRRLLLLPGTRHLAEMLLNRLAGLLARRHAGMLDRLADFAGATCLIVPRDLPAAFLLTLQPAAQPPQLELVDPACVTDARATIRTDLATLLKLLEGRIDGDALFFSRDLMVEGDMEVVVALRNAVDDAGIDLIGDSAAACGPFAAPAEKLGRHMAGMAARLHRRLAITIMGGDTA
ncbi:MAG: SCP2 sterol-binding domain-containing protein [Ferrovibrio sp.]|uniref:ubiquinone anaerobic biosynthesis accessory factor UbiT n=1 Tax=Ferrovibrio sp. TaxID=1917215 RepID=UPI0026225D64|nr:SCP2 sterol-binding domain-containing protein [Ferrovibrio sp.]MCW0234608.1 SCP2 sterol-binding domain-containing protein [Ferrovibrio sp.]